MKQQLGSRQRQLAQHQQFSGHDRMTEPGKTADQQQRQQQHGRCGPQPKTASPRSRIKHASGTTYKTEISSSALGRSRCQERGPQRYFLEAAPTKRCPPTKRCHLVCNSWPLLQNSSPLGRLQLFSMASLLVLGMRLMSGWWPQVPHLSALFPCETTPGTSPPRTANAPFRSIRMRGKQPQFAVSAR